MYLTWSSLWRPNFTDYARLPWNREKPPAPSNDEWWCWNGPNRGQEGGQLSRRRNRLGVYTSFRAFQPRVLFVRFSNGDVILLDKLSSCSIRQSPQVANKFNRKIDRQFPTNESLIIKREREREKGGSLLEFRDASIKGVLSTSWVNLLCRLTNNKHVIGLIGLCIIAWKVSI